LALMAILSLAAIAAAGGIAGYLLGPPKAFFSIVFAMLAWLAGGWFLGGWRAEMAGLAALTAALMASEGTYAIAVMFCCMAFLFLFADIAPRRSRLRSERFN